MRIGKIASGAEYRMDEQFQNSLIFRLLIVFQIKKKSKNFEFRKFPKFLIWKISHFMKLLKLANWENDQIFEIV